MSAGAITADAAHADDVAQQRAWLKWHLYLGYVGLALGGFFGLLQALDRLGLDLYGAQQFTYFQGLTIHGVGLVLVFTFAFSNSWLTLATMRGFERPMVSTGLVATSTALTGTGVLLALVPMLSGGASVLFTMYPPLQADTLFYLGATLIVVSTWVVLANMLLTRRAWKADNPDAVHTPLTSYVSIMTYLMWTIASVGIAVEMLAFVIPWSLGWIDQVDPLTTRTLFWLTGHPIVYFWLLPAYVSWYMVVPSRTGGRLHSDGLIRIVFLMFLLLSTPVGLHHQFTDPGVDSGLKLVHGMMTFGVFLPSMITAFSLMAALEEGAKRKGGRGLVGWIRKLPWGDPVVTGQLLAMLAFMLGGISGLINSSYTLNLVVHNSAFIPGHFHLTVGSAVAMSIFALTYWLVPHLTGRSLWGRRVALAQSWIYFVGVLTFSRGQMAGGLEGQPRRLHTTGAAYENSAWDIANVLTGVGGLLMVVAGILFFVVLIGTLTNKVEATELERSFPLTETIYDASATPTMLERIGVWSGIAIALVLAAYIPAFVQQGLNPVSPGYTFF